MSERQQCGVLLHGSYTDRKVKDARRERDPTMSTVFKIRKMIDGYITVYGKPPLYLYVSTGVAGKLRNELNIPEDAELDTLHGLKLVYIGEVAVGREMICYATAVD